MRRKSERCPYAHRPGVSNSFHEGQCLRVLGFSFQSRPRQPGEGSSFLISDLNSIKYKGGAKNTQTLGPPWNEFDTRVIDHRGTPAAAMSSAVGYTELIPS